VDLRAGSAGRAGGARGSWAADAGPKLALRWRSGPGRPAPAWAAGRGAARGWGWVGWPQAGSVATAGPRCGLGRKRALAGWARGRWRAAAKHGWAGAGASSRDGGADARVRNEAADQGALNAAGKRATRRDADQAPWALTWRAHETRTRRRRGPVYGAARRETARARAGDCSDVRPAIGWGKKKKKLLARGSKALRRRVHSGQRQVGKHARGAGSKVRRRALCCLLQRLDGA
jgi:hypothetical protein